MFNKIKKIIIIHWLIIIVALIVGFVAIRPNLSAINAIGLENFKGIYPILTDDEEYYFGRVKETLDGHPGLGNIYINEHKDKPFMAPPLAEYFFAGISRLSGVSIPGIFLISDFVFPFLGIIVLYAVILSVSSSKRIALGIALLFYVLFMRESTRAINHQFTYPFLFMGLWLVWKTYITEYGKKAFKYHLWFSAVFCVLLYIYPHFWTPLAALYGISTLAKAWQSRQWREAIKGFGLFFASSLLLGGYYFYNLSLALRDPVYLETARRMGLIDTYWPGALYNVFPVFCSLCLIFFARKKIKNTAKLNFTYYVLITGVIINWQNLITGKYMFFSIHYLQPSYLLVLFALAVILSEVDIFERLNKRCLIKNIIIAFGVVSIIGMMLYYCYGGIKIVLTSNISPEYMEKLQKRRPVFDWLNTNTKKDSVVLFWSEGYYLTSIPIYTYNNLYWGGFITSFLVSDEEIIDRWVRYNIFNDKIDEEYIKNDNNIFTLLANRFIDDCQKKQVRRKIFRFLGINPGPEPEKVPQWFTDRVLERYREAKKTSVEEALKKFELDYILLDLSDPEFYYLRDVLGSLDFISRVEQVDEVVIYKVD